MAPLNILQLPDKIWLKILKFLSPPDIFAVSQQSPSLFRMCNDPQFWQHVRLRFHDESDPRIQGMVETFGHRFQILTISAESCIIDDEELYEKLVSALTRRCSLLKSLTIKWCPPDVRALECLGVRPGPKLSHLIGALSREHARIRFAVTVPSSMELTQFYCLEFDEFALPVLHLITDFDIRSNQLDEHSLNLRFNYVQLYPTARFVRRLYNLQELWLQAHNCSYTLCHTLASYCRLMRYLHITYDALDACHLREDDVSGNVQWRSITSRLPELKVTYKIRSLRSREMEPPSFHSSREFIYAMAPYAKLKFDIAEGQDSRGITDIVLKCSQRIKSVEVQLHGCVESIHGQLIADFNRRLNGTGFRVTTVFDDDMKLVGTLLLD